MDDKIISELRTVLTRLIKKLRRKSAGAQQLSLTERSTIALLDQYTSLLPSELASMEKITNQSMSQILNHLAALSYIVRTPSVTDKRKVIITLSATGAGMLIQMRSERDEWLKRAIAETCSPTEQELLSKVLGPLTKLVDFE